jgi:hypothetical protein
MGVDERGEEKEVRGIALKLLQVRLEECIRPGTE